MHPTDTTTPQTRFSRRGVLAGALGLAAGAGVGHAGAASVSPAPRRSLRLAHPSDIHVQPELKGGEAMVAAFRHMMALDTRP
ncbi:MAG: hypothetical protein ACK58T_27030, partial [Phycisphaerae bacterium]